MTSFQRVEPFVLQRELMVHQQLEQRRVSDLRVLTAMRRVPRHLFVQPQELYRAYADEAVPTLEGQRVAQPYIVARMLESARVGACDRVLEVGCGSGYTAALCSLLAQEVFTLERHESLAQVAHTCLDPLEYPNVLVRHGDGLDGWPEHGPYDVILVAAAPRALPLNLLDQLAVGGRLIVPGGPLSHQTLLRITRMGQLDFEQHPLESVRLPPLLPGITHAQAG